MPRIRLYRSALADVKYVMKAPLPFDPDPATCERRAELKAKAIAAARDCYDS